MPQCNAGDWLQGPFWPAPVQVLSIHPRTAYDIVTVQAAPPARAARYILTPIDWQQVQCITRAPHREITFEAAAARFRLGIQAHRLRLAHALDPYAALNASRVDPLPHQFEAVYQHLLARPVIRALLAHDAGAGKTIMAGLVIKELQRRQGVHRVLIVAPAGLTSQWQRELRTKFGLDFTIVSRAYMKQEQLYSLDVWRETDTAITSLAFARQPAMRQVLEGAEWDLVVVDEAHYLAAYAQPNGAVRKTQAYKLGEILAHHTTHFLLMTATPHKGDPANYRLLINLIDPQWGEAARYASAANPVVLRRTKEEMCQPDGTPLYPERVVETLTYSLSPSEGDFLEQVQKFIQKHYAAAQQANQAAAAFALVTLERRLASSTYALGESLRRMHAQIAARLAEKTAPRGTAEPALDWADWEELREGDRWTHERRAEEAVAGLFTRRQLRRELPQLESLIARAAELMQHGRQEKITALRAACRLWVRERGERLIIFTEFKDTLDYLQQRLTEWGYTTTQIHGGMTMLARRQAEKALWRGTAPILLATEAAGEGINLQCCRVMINFDIPWNPCRLEQRMGRIHRYGQRAAKVHIFNLIATNTMEDAVKAAILQKMELMRRDLGDRVFNVLGETLWGAELRRTLERIALGDRTAQAEALALVDRAEVATRAAITAERRAAAAPPLDMAEFRRQRATLRAHRLSPETAEQFFRRAVPFTGGGLREFVVTPPNAPPRPAFEVTLPPELAAKQGRKLTGSFWAEICSDDDTEEDAVLFIAPGQWFFEWLLDRVITMCAPDLARGAVFFDLHATAPAPYLIWFVRSDLRDGLNRPAADLLTAVQHRADAEQVTPLPTEILEAFETGEGLETPEVPDAVMRVQPMLRGQSAVVDQCVQQVFLAELTTQRARRRATVAHDRQFLAQGLRALIDHWNTAALEAFSAADVAAGNALTDRGAAVQARLQTIQQELDHAAELLLGAPEVLGVALVLPAPLEIAAPDANDERRAALRQDPAVEAAAMQQVMAYEISQGRHPRDVHQGQSWDIESDDDAGVPVRYIEVKGRGPATAQMVSLTTPEWAAARRLGAAHWLYIVRLGDGLMWLIQNPYAKLQPRELRRWLVRVSAVAAQAEVVKLPAASGRRTVDGDV